MSKETEKIRKTIDIVELNSSNVAPSLPPDEEIEQFTKLSKMALTADQCVELIHSIHGDKYFK